MSSHMPRTAPSSAPLVGGIVAGPLFIAVSVIQGFTRQGFDPTYHPISLLSLGDLGWIQIANFVITGALFVWCAIGMGRALGSSRAGTWPARLVGAIGAGLSVAGVFVTDPGGGFPPGAPAGRPLQISWHGVLHEIGFVVVLLSWTALCFVLRRRFAALAQRGWVRTCIATLLTVIVLMSWPDLESLSVRLVLASAMQFGLVAAFAAHLKRGLPAFRQASDVSSPSSTAPGSGATTSATHAVGVSGSGSST